LLAPPKSANDSKDISGDGEDSTLDETDCFAVPSRIRRSKKANKENSTSVLNDDIVPAAPTRLSRQRSRPLVTLPEGSNNASVAAPPSLDGTFNVNSIEDDPSDPPPKTKPAEVGSDSDEDEDTLDGEMEAVEGTPESFKLPALKARKAHKYVNQVNKEGGYFSPKYVPVNPGLQSDDVM